MKLASFDVGPDRPFFLIAGPCVIESEGLVLDVAGSLKEMTAGLGIPFIFKASFDKANRSSRDSFRGPGLEEGLKALAQVRKQIGVPVLTDVHEDTPLGEVAAVVDVLQTPAFLCRQTNFIVAAASQDKPVNIKKGQFLSPWEMQNVVDKARSTGNAQIMVCERGFSFGYNNLVSDMRSSRSCAARVPGRIRRHALGAAARAARANVLRRPARVRAGPGARRGCGGIRRNIHGDASRSGEGACRMARTHGRWTAWHRCSPRSRSWTVR